MIFTLNAPMFDLLVLAVIAQGDAYGYQISRRIKRASNTKDSTLYPVLRRLQEHRFLVTYDQQFQGRNRKYYRITEEGKEHYQTLTREWADFTGAIRDILEGGTEDDKE